MKSQCRNLGYFPIDFNCISVTGMCILVKIYQTVTDTVIWDILYLNLSCYND